MVFYMRKKEVSIMSSEKSSSFNNTPRNQKILDAHREPFYNIAREPWIPIKKDGQISLIGLKELLLELNLIEDIAESDPLIRASLRRFLEDIAVAIILNSASQESYYWKERFKSNSGFLESEIIPFLDSIDRFLWLYHPKTPFLQKLELAEIEKNTPTSINALIPSLSGDSESTWFTKPNDKVFNRGLLPIEAVKSLISKHYYGLNGNGGIGDRGGSYSEGPATVSNIFRVSNVSLFSTLLRNITTQLINDEIIDGQPSGLYWLDDALAKPGGNSLYKSSLSVTHALLGERLPNGYIQEMLRGSLGNKESEALIRNESKEVDRHSMVINDGKKSKRIRIDPIMHPISRLHSLLDLVRTDNNLVSGVGVDSNLWLNNIDIDEEDIELLLGSKAGNGMSPKWKHIMTIRVTGKYVDPRFEESKLLSETLSDLLNNKNSPLLYLGYAIKNALDIKDNDSSIVVKGKTFWLDALNEKLFGSTTLMENIISIKKEVPSLTIKIYNKTVKSFEGTSNLASKIAISRKSLTSRMWREEV